MMIYLFNYLGGGEVTMYINVELMSTNTVMIVFINSKKEPLDIIFVAPDSINTKKKFSNLWLGMRRKAKRITNNKQRVN